MMLNSIAKSVCLTLVLTASSPVKAFAAFTSLLGLELKYAKTIVIEGKEYSTAGLPNIHADAPREECSVSTNKDCMRSLVNDTIIPMERTIVRSNSGPGIPLISLIKREDKPITLEFRTATSGSTAYNIDAYSAHPLIAHLIEQLQTLSE